MAQLGRRHGNAALMVGDHHRCEVAVGVARRYDVHTDHHLSHCRSVLCNEWRLGRPGRTALGYQNGCKSGDADECWQAE